MRIVILLHLLVSTCFGFSQGSIALQDKPFVYKEVINDTSILNVLNSNPLFLKLSSSEREFYYWTNVLRKNPARFNKIIIQEFLKQFPEAVSASSKSLNVELARLNSGLPFLYPDSGLIKMALTHAKDLKSRNGILSHQSMSGKEFVQRIKESGNYRCGAENLFVGSPTPIESLVLLLIDEGVKDKGHRKNLLDPSFSLMGVSFSFVNEKKAIIVQDFGCR